MAKNLKNSPKYNQINLDMFDIPDDYFELNKFEKEAVCLIFISHLLTLIEREFHPIFNRMDIMNSLLTYTINEHERLEMYEICQVLKDIKTLVNEQTN